MLHATHARRSFDGSPIRGLLLSGAIAFGSTGALAHDLQPDVPAVAPGTWYAPSPIPDRIILTLPGDPRTSAAVTWRTSAEVHAAYAEIAPATHGPGFVAQARRLDATATPFHSDLSESLTQRVWFDGLEPATSYVYRVGDGTNWSEWHQFTTAPAEPEPFSFVYFGDSQNSVRSMWSRVVREAFRDAPRAAFMLHAGDLVNRAASDAEWGEWFEAAGWINAAVPVVATPGNHEYTRIEQPDGTRVRTLTDHWLATFTLPQNGPSELDTTCYFMDYGNMRLISLNSNEAHEIQRDWVEAVLADTDADWVVLTFHHPLYSMAVRRDNPDLRALWKPVFDRYGVDLVLQGHDHTYGRSALVGPPEPGDVNVDTGVRVRSQQAGTVYVVSVSGPKMYEQKDEFGIEIRRAAEDTQLYQIITVDGLEMRYEARTAMGTLYDAFTLQRGADGRNRLIERGAEMPERRR